MTDETPKESFLTLPDSAKPANTEPVINDTLKPTSDSSTLNIAEQAVALRDAQSLLSTLPGLYTVGIQYSKKQQARLKHFCRMVNTPIHDFVRQAIDNEIIAMFETLPPEKQTAIETLIGEKI